MLQFVDPCNAVSLNKIVLGLLQVISKHSKERVILYVIRMTPQPLQKITSYAVENNEVDGNCNRVYFKAV